MAKGRSKPTNNKQVEHYKRAMEEGDIPDEQNPVSEVQVFPGELLVKIALGELDMRAFAVHELKTQRP